MKVSLEKIIFLVLGPWLIWLTVQIQSIKETLAEMKGKNEKTIAAAAIVLGVQK